MDPINHYYNLVKIFSEQKESLKKQSNSYSTARLFLALLILFLLYKFTESTNFLYIIGALATLGAFVAVVSKHRKILWEKKLSENRIVINNNEINYLEKRIIPFWDGSNYVNPSHAYTFDLDVFGMDSLFHHLNRTSTHIGEKTLAGYLTQVLPNKDIIDNQQAINELAKKLEWRQHLAALGKTITDNEADYKKLINWSLERQIQISNPVNLLSFILPLVFLVAFGASLFGFVGLKWVILSFVVNLGLFGTQSKKIKSEVVDAKNIAEIVKHYGLILGSIEQENFTSLKLKQLQKELQAKKASGEIKKLSDVFLKIQGVNFDLGAIVLNGTLTYHIHALRSLIKWKDKNADNLKSWLGIMGEIDALNSLANLGYNNPEFIYPDLNSDFKTSFTHLGHPLISERVRVTNSVTLNKSNFVILTGSNMSGKSTFLRTLGINMVLTGMGAPICATEASVHPLPILVSMRQSDSLSSGESYFFAEVKRLKSIIEKLKTETCFVLLDEILRGTNSDDKQSGTIGVIQKIISLSAVGGIATHDLEVCKMTDEYPDKLENKNFEVEIINDELVFDYKLRDGICQNKSATFLMKKMEII